MCSRLLPKMIPSNCPLKSFRYSFATQIFPNFCPKALKDKYEKEVSSSGTEEMVVDEIELEQKVKTLKRKPSQLAGGGSFKQFTDLCSLIEKEPSYGAKTGIVSKFFSDFAGSKFLVHTQHTNSPTHPNHTDYYINIIAFTIFNPVRLPSSCVFVKLISVCTICARKRSLQL